MPFREFVTFGAQMRDNALGIDERLRAAERDERDLGRGLGACGIGRCPAGSGEGDGAHPVIRGSWDAPSRRAEWRTRVARRISIADTWAFRPRKGTPAQESRPK